MSTKTEEKTDKQTENKWRNKRRLRITKTKIEKIEQVLFKLFRFNK